MKRRVLLAVSYAVVFMTALACGAPRAPIAPAATSRPCVTSAAGGYCGPYLYRKISSSWGLNTQVNQNIFNTVPGSSQTLTAVDPGNWQVRAIMPAGNTGVVSYPDVQNNYDNTVIDHYRSLTSSFSESMHPNRGTKSEATYDVWLNSWGNEVMIWVDNYGQAGLAYDTRLGSMTIGGEKFWVYRNGPPGGELIVALDRREQAGTVHILATLRWLEHRGYLPTDSTMVSLEFGWEISSTGGLAETYRLSCYAITENGKGGGTCIANAP